MRKTLTLLLTIIFFLFSISPVAAQIEPSISAASAILVDAKSGQILWQRNAHQRRPMASTTKIMTAILILEYGRLVDVVTTTQQASDVGESEIYLTAGERRTVEELLYSMMLESANDAAVALAEYMGGTVENFVQLMNRKARIIGSHNTHFANPHGFHSDDHYATAYDLSLIARYGLLDAKFAEIVSTKDYTIPWSGNQYPRRLKNHNKLLWRYPHADGIKTGYTKQAGHCLISSATKDNIRLICVVLGALNSEACYNDSQQLLEYGFNSFRREKVVRKGKVYAQVLLPMWGDRKLSLIASRDLTFLVKQQPRSLKTEVKVDRPVSLPITKGQKIGEIRVIQDGYELGRADLVTERTIFEPTFVEKLFIYIGSLMRKAWRRR
ncbi:MAG: D-alanyl-D-alanine carboxypeptidase family protein [Actinomycetota bacterium]